MKLRITVGSLKFTGTLEIDRAPNTCAAFVTKLPFRGQLVQARWSGEAGWIPLGDFDFGVSVENATTDPAPGHLLLYSGTVSETEILFPYGVCRFASKFGPLAGNHFVTVVASAEQFATLGERLLRGGAQEIVFEEERDGR